ncbi:MAG: hypothetical protein ACI9Z9_001089, partial [Litorivivens sp.]
DDNRVVGFHSACCALKTNWMKNQSAIAIQRDGKS